MNGRSVLILGGGTMQIPALQSALAKGWKVFVADGNPDAPGASLCRQFLHVDLRDEEGMVEAARELMEKESLDGVFTAGTDFSHTVAVVADALGLPGIPPEVARAASDKVRMREVFEEHGISAPRFVEIALGEDARERVGELSFPLVVKPVDNMGARGVRRIDTCNELTPAVEEARENSHSRRVIVEEFIEGPEFSIDALVEEGDVRITGFADRIIRFSPFFVELGHTLPTEIEPSLRGRLEESFIEAVHALGIDNGAAKGDVKWNGREPVIGEVAARLSGGYMSGWTFPYATGVDLTGAGLNIAVRLPAGDLSPQWERVSAERAFVSLPGTVESVEGIEEAKALDGVEELFLRVSSGDEVRFPTNNVEKCGNVIAVSEKREEAVGTAEGAIQRILVRLQPNNRRTERFLFHREQGWVEDAFTLNVPENHSAFLAMEPFRFIEKTSSPEHIDLVVAPLPSLELENAVDWHGGGIAETVNRVLARTHTRFSSPIKKIAVSGYFHRFGCRCAACETYPGESIDEGPVELGSLFWISLLRGGFQGAVWVIDTVRKLVQEEKDLHEWWRRVGSKETSEAGESSKKREAGKKGEGSRHKK